MSTKAFQIQEVLKEGWENFKKNPVLLICLLLLSIAVTFLIGMIFGSLPPIIVSIINGAATSYIMLSTIKATVLLSKGETPGWDVLKNDVNLYLKFFVASILLSIVFLVATILLIIPLLLAMAVFFLVPYIIVDRKDISIIGAFKKSWELTTPQFMSCLIFVIVIFILAIVGMIPVGLGLLIVVPLIYTTSAIIYRRLDGKGSSTVETTASSVSAE